MNSPGSRGWLFVSWVVAAAGGCAVGLAISTESTPREHPSARLAPSEATPCVDPDFLACDRRRSELAPVDRAQPEAAAEIRALRAEVAALHREVDVIRDDSIGVSARAVEGVRLVELREIALSKLDRVIERQAKSLDSIDSGRAGDAVRADMQESQSQLRRQRTSIQEATTIAVMIRSLRGPAVDLTESVLGTPHRDN
jgi:hypothetical protein